MGPAKSGASWQGHTVARCTVERLMRELGIAGAVRGKKVITTNPDHSAERAPDLLDCDFVASAPNRSWVADFTHVKTWSGIIYVAFVVDTFSRRIVGWAAATTKRGPARPGRTGREQCVIGIRELLGRCATLKA
ncbi:DDE-type integrase/transposase/recombinase [Streptomyces sp. NPDC001832]|uniref:DDE-type integrase/transposase/recombinase n=1 Tax=Streptomyces sp. NPDC001832 TaxID=3154527 RepID=UPI00331FC9C2